MIDEGPTSANVKYQRSDEGLTLETSAFKLFTAANLRSEKSHLKEYISFPIQTTLRSRWREHRINISIWATAHLPLPWPNINPNMLLVDRC